MARSTRSREVSDTRAAVLEAALEVFARDGVQATRLEDVASAAGVTRATLYYHFHGKEELVEALIDRAVGGLSRELLQADDAPVEEIVTTLLDACAAEEDLYRLLFTELWGSVDPRVLFERIEREIIAPITGRLARAVEAGEIRRVDPRVAALALYGQTTAVALGDVLHDRPVDRAAVGAEVAALVDAALRPGV